MKKRKSLLGLLIVIAMSISVCIPACANEGHFSDVPTEYWAFKPIQKSVADGIATGYPDGTFHPTGQVTYAQFSAFLTRAFFNNKIEDAADSSEWYTPYITVLEGHNILQGTKLSVSFAAYINSPIIRYDMAQMMYNILLAKGVILPNEDELSWTRTNLRGWSDISESYQDAVANCYSIGVLTGQSDGYFGGDNLMNRAQGCVVIDRLREYITNHSEPLTEATGEGKEPDGEITNTSSEFTLTNGKEISIENVQEILEELKEAYPQDYPWGENDSYYSTAFGFGSECAGFAFLISDLIFGNIPKRIMTDYNNIRPGDVIEMKNSSGTYHWEVATTAVDSDGFFGIVSGNNDGKVGWGWSPVDVCEENDYVIYTRYPS